MPYHDLGTPSQSAVTHHNAFVPGARFGLRSASRFGFAQSVARLRLVFSENSSPSNLHVSIVIISMEDVGKQTVMYTKVRAE